MYSAIRSNELGFLFTLLHIFENSKFNSESIETPNSVCILLDLTEISAIVVFIKNFELNKRRNVSGFALTLFFSKQLKSFSEIDFSSVITAGVSLAHV